MEASSVVKGTLKLTSTEVIRYLGLALFYVVVAKTGALTETDLGVLSILMFLGTMIPILTSLSLPTALTKYVSESLKKGEKTQAAIIQKTVNTRVFALSTLGLVVSILLSGSISLYFWKSQVYAPLIILMSFYAYFLSLVLLFNSTLQALYLFDARAVVTIVEVALSMSLATLLALLNFGLYGVMLGYIVGYGIAAAVSFFYTRGKLSSPHSYTSVKPLLKFSLPLLLGSIVLLSQHWADIVVLASITSDYAVTGIYYLAARSVTFLSVLYLPIAYTVLPFLSAKHGVKDIQGIANTLQTASRYIHYLMVPPCLGLAVIAPTALGVVYGQNYAYGSVSFAILSITQILVALYMVLTTTLTAIGKTSDIMKINIISVFSYVVLLLVLVSSFPRPDIGAASARFAMQLIALALTVYLLNRTLKVQIDKESLWKSAVASLAIVPALVLTESVLPHLSVYLFVVDVLVAASVYLLVLYLLRAFGHEDFELLRRTFPSLTKYINVAEKTLVRKI